MKNILLLSFSLLSLCTFSQTNYDSTKLSPLIKKITFQIDTSTNTDGENIFWGYNLSHLKLLKERAKINELIQLVNHPNPYIRINAFNFLLDSAYPKFVDIIEEHMNDTAIVYIGNSHQALLTNVIEGMFRLTSWNNNWIVLYEQSGEINKRLGILYDKYLANKKNKLNGIK